LGAKNAEKKALHYFPHFLAQPALLESFSAMSRTILALLLIALGAQAAAPWFCMSLLLDCH